MRNAFILFVFALFVGTVSAQEATVSKTDYKREKADQFLFEYSYQKAIPLYMGLYEDGDKSVSSQIALCFYKIGELDSAANFYQVAAAQDSLKADDIYNYYSVLLKKGKKSEAEKWLKVFQQLNPSDSRAQRYFDKAEIEDLSKPIDEDVVLTNMAINSEQADFGAVEFNGNVVFTSNRERIKPIVREYNWDGNPFLSLYQSSTANDSEGGVEFFDKSSSFKFHQGPIAFTADGKGAWVTRNYPNKKKSKSNDGTLPLQLFYAEIEKEKLVNTIDFAHNSNQYSVGQPAVSVTGDTLFFASDMPGGFGGADIYFSVRDTNGNWSEPTNLGDKVNTEGNEMFPFVFGANTLYFSSDGHYGLGGLDIYEFKLGSEEVPENMHAPFNSSMDDFAFFMNKNGNGYVSSNRAGGRGDDDVYSFFMNLEETILELSMVDKETGEPLSNTTIYIYDENGNPIDSAQTDEQGKFNLELTPGTNLVLKTKKEGYEPQELEVDADKIIADGNTNQKIEIAPIKAAEFPVTAKIFDYMTGKPISGAKVVLLDQYNNPLDTIISDGKGNAILNLKEGMKYVVLASQDGFELYKDTLVADGKFIMDDPNANNTIEIGLKPYVEVGNDLAELIDINPIYFDLGKSFIRPDAASELDKIVDILKKYPNMVIEVGSHTDCRSSEEFNRNLSEARATSSKKYIQERITNPERVYGKGYGESKPKINCNCWDYVGDLDCTEEQHQLNRRTEFRIVKMD